MIRIIKDLSLEKRRVKFISENVASMDKKDRDIFTKLLRTKPVRACAGGLSHVRRMRYYWLNWNIPPSPGVSVAEDDELRVVSFDATLPQPSEWIDRGWEWRGESPSTVKGARKVLHLRRVVKGTLRLPTFMRALPKKLETFLPAGIDATPPDAQAR